MTDQLPPPPTVPDRRGHYVATKPYGRVWVGSTNGHVLDLQARIDEGVIVLRRYLGGAPDASVSRAIRILEGP